MPPLFGILNIDQSVDYKDRLQRMIMAAEYKVPREIHTSKWNNGVMNFAVVKNRSYSNCFTEKENWCIVADASLYGNKQDNNEDAPVADCEIILEAWTKWKEDCVNHLKGDFAFVIYNKVTREIFCGRDPIGIRPLFYTIENNSFIFSSELRIMLSGSTHQRISDSYLMNVLTGLKSKRDHTAYPGIYRLMPGTTLCQKEGYCKITSYWPPSQFNRTQFQSESEYTGLLRQKLTKAVFDRCPSSGDIGVELSGGLDSSAILGICSNMSLQNKNKIISFSNVLPEGNDDLKDEHEFIAPMIAFAGNNGVYIDHFNCNIFDLLKHSISIQGGFPELQYNVYNRPLFEAAAKESIEVLFSGFGGDEVVSGSILMPWEEIFKERQYRILLDELFFDGLNLRSVIRSGKAVFRILRSFILPWYVRKGPFSKGKMIQKFRIFPLKKNFAHYKIIRLNFLNQYKFRKTKSLYLRQLARILHNGLPLRLEYCYTAAAQYGLEYRYPLLDVDLIETVLAFPPWIKLHHGIKRYAFRQAIQGFVPEKIRLRNDKSGSTIPQMITFIRIEQENIRIIIRSAKNTILKYIIDFSAMEKWFDAVLIEDGKNYKYQNLQLFFNYLIVLYYYGYCNQE